MYSYAAKPVKPCLLLGMLMPFIRIHWHQAPGSPSTGPSSGGICLGNFDSTFWRFVNAFWSLFVWHFNSKHHRIPLVSFTTFLIRERKILVLFCNVQNSQPSPSHNLFRTVLLFVNRTVVLWRSRLCRGWPSDLAHISVLHGRLELCMCLCTKPKRQSHQSLWHPFQGVHI